MPDLSVVVVSWNTKALTLRCLRSALATCGGDAEVLVVDNGSTDGSADAIAAEFPGVKLVRHPDNRGYAGGVNAGVEAAEGSTILLLGSDTEPRPGSIEHLRESLRELSPDYAAVAPQLLEEDGSVQPSCRGLPTPGALLLDLTGLRKIFPRSRLFGGYRMTYWDHADERDVVQPQMTCLLVRREAFDSVGLLDGDAFPVYFNDVDWCTRLHRRGLRIHFRPRARVVHGYGRSTRLLGKHRRAIWREGFVAYYRKWYGDLRYLPARAFFSLVTYLWSRAGD